MNMVDWSDSDLNAEFVFDRNIGPDSTLIELQRLIAEFAPRWASTLRVWRSQRDQRTVPVDQPNSLRYAVVEAAGKRGPTYQRLVNTHGRPPSERLRGTAEVRGRSRHLTVVVGIDEFIASHIGSRVDLGNSISLQVRGTRVEARDSATWLEEVFSEGCKRLSPAWASAESRAEYWAKVMATNDRIEAIGRDFGQHLPGLFWLNYFGARYTSFIGRNRLLSTPAVSVAMVGDGISIKLGNRPTDWKTEPYIEVERQARSHLGAEVFFAKSNPSRGGRAPVWIE